MLIFPANYWTRFHERETILVVRFLTSLFFILGEFKEKFKPVDPESTIIDETDLEDDTSISLCNCNADKENKQLKNYLQLSYDEIQLRENQYLDLYKRYQEVEHERSRLAERANDLFGEFCFLYLRLVVTVSTASVCLIYINLLSTCIEIENRYKRKV